MVKRRYFNKREKQALFLAADGKSDLSGDPLANDWHADHQQPWSRGGVTDVINARALNPNENLSKGSRVMFEPRQWQSEMLNIWDASTLPDFLAAVIPAGGKTIGALLCGKRFLEKHTNCKIVVVVHSLPVQTQWQREAAKLGIELQNDLAGSFKAGFHGAVCTYQGLATGVLATVLRNLTSRYDIMAMGDEIHHLRRDAAWGAAYHEAFEFAARRLALSGTPFRTDGEQIPFLRVKDGEYVCDFRYDYPRALQEKYIRKISFHRFDGNLYLDGECVEGEVDGRLTKLMRTHGFPSDMLTEAHEKLLALRRRCPNAGGLILCIDTAHAEFIGRQLAAITGEHADIVVADEDVATTSIDDFRRSNRKWLISVRKVSEGVDIRRLAVLVYLTNVASNLFFRQAMGRIMRREGKVDRDAYAFIPADPQLCEHAAEIETWQAQITETDSDDDGTTRTRQLNNEGELPFSPNYESDAEFAGLIIGGDEHDVPLSERVIEFAEHFGVSEAEALAMLTFRSTEEQPDPLPKQERMDKLRIEINSVVNKIVRQEGGDYKQTHKELGGGFWQPDMTEEQLQKKLERAKLRFRNAKTRSA